MENLENVDFSQKRHWYGRRLGSPNGREFTEEEIAELRKREARCKGACCTAFGDAFSWTVN